jgi:hypothetical protein
MTLFEVILSFSSLAIGVVAVCYVAHLIKISGRGRPEDQERVQRFIDQAPYEELDKVLRK